MKSQLIPSACLKFGPISGSPTSSRYTSASRPVTTIRFSSLGSPQLVIPECCCMQFESALPLLGKVLLEQTIREVVSPTPRNLCWKPSAYVWHNMLEQKIVCHTAASIAYLHGPPTQSFPATFASGNVAQYRRRHPKHALQRPRRSFVFRASALPCMRRSELHTVATKRTLRGLELWLIDLI
jgi:hypothetical protein